MAGIAAPSPEFWSDRRVLIIGNTGFKGSWLSLWLHRLGARVLGLSLPPPTTPSLFALANLSALLPTTLTDTRDPAAVCDAMRDLRPEFVFHLAAQPLVRESYRDPVATYATNVMGTVHVLEAVRSVSTVRSVVVVTSDKCYENREWPWAYRETEAMGGRDPYSSSKGCAELVTAAYRRSFLSGIGMATVRAGNVIGGGDWAEDRLLPDCMRALADGRPIALRNPHAVRPWQHVLEPLCGYLMLAERLADDPAAFSGAWNFGPADQDAKPVAWIADRVVAQWGNGATWSVSCGNAPHEANVLKVDASKACLSLGWEPRLKLEAAVAWTVDWYLRLAGGEPALGLTDQQLACWREYGT
ncbi:MAG TPA: CDP-glucose 4,6-dehydratase [Acetobacteraceae bacterium]|nr:CDP-glucose 4,6-dehydratase [Acetobacteraceae bacterium]